MESSETEYELRICICLSMDLYIFFIYSFIPASIQAQYLLFQNSKAIKLFFKILRITARHQVYHDYQDYYIF